MNTSELERRIADMGELKSDLAFLPPLFEDADELAAFRARHAQAEFERQGIYEATGPLFLGIDAGSTTLKLVALNADAQIVYSVYEPIRGDLVETLREALDELYRKIEPPSYLPHAKSSTWIARACATVTARSCCAPHSGSTWAWSRRPRTFDRRGTYAMTSTSCST